MPYRLGFRRKERPGMCAGSAAAGAWALPLSTAFDAAAGTPFFSFALTKVY
jgi:hypothetical protein